MTIQNNPAFVDKIASKLTVYETCPCCGQKKALAVSMVDDKRLVHCFYGCSQDDVWRAIGRQGESNYRPPVKTRQRVKWESLAYIQQLWNASLPAGGTLVETYLRERGLEGTP
jgi:hypothetical protein